MLAMIFDDLVFAPNSTRLPETLQERLSADFKIKLFGNLTTLFGW